MQMRCAALTDQRKTRDLRLLEDLVDQVDWLSVDELRETRAPALMSGSWVADNESTARELATSRSRAGRATMFLAPLRAGDWRELLGAPTAIDVGLGQAGSLRWHDGTEYQVPSVTCIRTSLHAGQWANSDAGPVVLAYRATTSSGPIVLCAANLTSSQINVDEAAQRTALRRLLVEVGTAESAETESDETPAPLDTAEEFLVATAGPGASLSLALIAAGGDRSADLAGVARDVLGLALPAGHEALLERLPAVSMPELEAALAAHGWSAHLRHLRRHMTEAKP
ncbi:MAG: hypothetical protein RLP09_30650 [Sandaracinaceae bacterium]